MNSESSLREEAGKLLTAGAVEMVIGYGRGHGGDGARPLFAKSPGDADGLIFNDSCVHNLATYLSREPCRQIMLRGGKVGVVAKGCDARAIVVLLQEGQISRDRVHIIGMVCSGVRRAGAQDDEKAFKCRNCGVRTPPVYDTLVGDPPGAVALDGDPLEDVREIASLSRRERWDFWTEHLSRCIKCYACREACPMCYCETCITERSEPQWIDRASHLRGALAYHLIRAMHLAGRCVSCGECGRACPMDIPVDLISRYLAAEVEEAFDYRTGMDPDQTPVFRTYGEDDPGDFIG